MNELEPRPGSYVLWLELEHAHKLRVGRLATRLFQPGFYAYVGSAFGPGGVRARLGRHIRPNKVKRWHIDYLRAVAKVRNTWVSYDEKHYEHDWARALIELSGLEIPLNGFGSSDCDCKTHLARFECLPTRAEFLRQLAGPLPHIQVMD